MERIVNLAARACAVATLCAACAAIAEAQTFTTLFSFNFADGNECDAPLIQGTNGDFYGTTFGGGSSREGTFFKITPTGRETALDSFDTNPWAPVVQDSNGNFYGTTFGGAANSGTVFEVNSSGTLNILYYFCTQPDCADGIGPTAGLIYSGGAFYGTTSYGGKYGASDGTGGTFFKITPTGTLTTLYTFCAQSACTNNGWYPGGLVRGTDGNFYGVTEFGGANGVGTIFRITPKGDITTLYSFSAVDGHPYAKGPLIQARSGAFYGTTPEAGSYGNGMVFRITPQGKFTVVYDFCGCGDGAGPTAPLVEAPNGKLYGTTQFEGAYGYGSVFEITPSGLLNTVYSFCAVANCPDGQNPYTGLLQSTNGDFYGSTPSGGAHDHGTVFRLSLGLPPFVEPQVSFGKVGSTVKILGTDLTGASSVTFNGASATFTVNSSTLIKAIVPADATSGTIEVTTPNGLLASNVAFQVTN